MVLYRSRMHKALKRNFQIMSGADWLAQLCRHIPHRFEHLVRSTWARLIHKVYVDPLECPRCKGPMRVIALIDDAAADWQPTSLLCEPPHRRFHEALSVRGRIKIACGNRIKAVQNTYAQENPHQDFQMALRQHFSAQY